MFSFSKNLWSWDDIAKPFLFSISLCGIKRNIRAKEGIQLIWQKPRVEHLLFLPANIQYVYRNMLPIGHIHTMQYYASYRTYTVHCVQYYASFRTYTVQYYASYRTYTVQYYTSSLTHIVLYSVQCTPKLSMFNLQCIAIYF